MPRIIHVAVDGSDAADGTETAPLRTIDHAATLALPGDTVRVHAGEYREWVDPRIGGLDPIRRITYEAAEGEHVVIKGSEPVSDWERVEGDAWRAEVPNSLFGTWNPFAEPLQGDWVVRPDDPPGEYSVHLGNVYLDGAGSFEVGSVDEVLQPQERSTILDDWTGITLPISDPASTLRVFHAEVGEETTVITANFPGTDPRDALVEISVRRSVFFPRALHIDHITVRGFEMCHAATPWAPPTGDQPGLIGPHWAKGWIIEDNHIHHAACSAISLGKERSTGHNYATDRGDKPGYQYQLESVFSARQIGWDREHIGSHIVRRNRIHDCGQNAIVGHLGCAFSTISENRISRIGITRTYFGHEIAGIKLHAPIDTRIEGNLISDCSLGIWLDWQTQGTRITRNVLWGNSRDLFIEVSHGPYVVDTNVLASPAAIEDVSQGGAYVHNLVGGTVRIEPVLDRATPYHRAHSTQVAGYSVIQQGDDRFIGNIFAGGEASEAYGPEPIFGPSHIGYGTAGFDGHPASFQDYLDSVPQTRSDHRRFADLPQPVYIRDNAYAAGAESYEHETGAVHADAPIGLSVRENEDGTVTIELDLPAAITEATSGPVGGEDLGHVRIVGLPFEENDGSPVRIDTDLLGQARTESSTIGPIGSLSAGQQEIRFP